MQPVAADGDVNKDCAFDRWVTEQAEKYELKN